MSVRREEFVIRGGILGGLWTGKWSKDFEVKAALEIHSF